MPVTVTKLIDTDTQAVLRVVGTFDAPNTSNVPLLTANTLKFANTSQPCAVDVEKIQFAARMGGYVAPTFVTTGNTPNVQIAAIATGVGEVVGLYSNELVANNSGNLGIQVYNANANDSFTLTITVRKATGFANAFAQYAGIGTVG